ncbi:hypothetical protein [Comamonas composti]|uniref:hypothetical protein n=1 Tax=Comamonas composti TaxID=408558 RepID=UPI0004168AC6|nr:hypothetical protein [Comamonas composti]
MINSATEAQRLQIANKSKSASIHSLSNRSRVRSSVKASPTAIPVKTADTKYTYAKFKPDPDGPLVNATMTGRYLGLELDYRK